MQAAGDVDSIRRPTPYRGPAIGGELRGIEPVTVPAVSMTASTLHAPVPVMLMVVPPSMDICSIITATYPPLPSESSTATEFRCSLEQEGGLPEAFAESCAVTQPCGGQRAAVQAVIPTTVTLLQAPPPGFMAALLEASPTSDKTAKATGVLSFTGYLQIGASEASPRLAAPANPFWCPQRAWLHP
jgi:hypothetical protein